MKIIVKLSKPLILALLIMVGSFVSLNITYGNSTQALSGSQFKAGRIIDDFTFYRDPNMSVGQIQSFLNSKVPTCDTNGTQPYAGTTRAAYGTSRGYPPPYTCLKDYRENVAARPANYYCSAVDAANRSAAEMIYTVAQKCRIDVKSLIVLLQKEQSLVTDDWPWSIQYRSATGYGCPDTSACDSEYYGFFNQVYNAAKQFNRYKTRAELFNYRAYSNNTLYYHPGPCKTWSGSNCVEYFGRFGNAPDIEYCGKSVVYIENYATAALYNYTPYQPNSAALNNLYGTGDGCSAYGNRNFWRMYNDWFGTSYSNDTAVAHPNGTLVQRGSGIYLVENEALRRIANTNVFLSYGYKWNQVKPATTGTTFLPIDEPINDLAPGTLFYANGTPLYVMDYEGSTLKKRHVSAAAFTAHGYTWSEVMKVPSWQIPAQTHSQMLLPESPHASGSLVVINGRVTLIEKGTTRHVKNSPVFVSHNYRWDRIKQAVSADLSLPAGNPLDFREGTMLLSGGIQLIGYDDSGIYKRPVGPWECYASKLRFTSQDWIAVSSSILPDRTLGRYSC